MNGRIRRILDATYDAAGVLAALCMVALLVVILLQMAARWLSVSFPGSTQYAGYLMASASFLAFAHTLNRGAHIRVSLLLTVLGDRRRPVEVWCMIVATAAACYLAYYAVRFVYWSFKLHEISQGQDATPMWIPQIPMAVGAVLLAVCFIDNLVALALTGRDNIGTDFVEQSHAE